MPLPALFSLWALVSHGHVGVPPPKPLPSGKEMSQLSVHSPFLPDETRTLGLCGMVWEHRKDSDYHKQPWQVKISVTVSTTFWWWGLVGGEVRVKWG